MCSNVVGDQWDPQEQVRGPGTRALGIPASCDIMGMSTLYFAGDDTSGNLLFILLRQMELLAWSVDVLTNKVYSLTDTINSVNGTLSSQINSLSSNVDTFSTKVNILDNHTLTLTRNVDSLTSYNYTESLNGTVASLYSLWHSKT